MKHQTTQPITFALWVIVLMSLIFMEACAPPSVARQVGESCPKNADCEELLYGTKGQQQQLPVLEHTQA